MLTAVYCLFLADAFVLQTVIQELVLVILVTMMYMWAIQPGRLHQQMRTIVRVMQLIYFLQGLLSFIVMMPLVNNIFGLKDRTRLISIFGIVGPEINQD